MNELNLTIALCQVVRTTKQQWSLQSHAQALLWKWPPCPTFEWKHHYRIYQCKSHQMVAGYSWSTEKHAKIKVNKHLKQY